jgi:hypothetical protein
MFLSENIEGTGVFVRLVFVVTGRLICGIVLTITSVRV